MPLSELRTSITGSGIDRQAAMRLSGLQGDDVLELFTISNLVRVKIHGRRVDLCSIVNAKSGACPEDCSFCAQSAHNKADIEVYPLISRERIVEAAESAKKNGARRFCIVKSGRVTSAPELESIRNAISGIRRAGLLPCATLGMLNMTALKYLTDAGLHRYHHNLETSEAFFKEICSTHTFSEKLRTLEAAKLLGLSVCSGGIFGLGESWEDRVDMAFALKEIGVDSVPVNFLSPVRGTPLEGRQTLDPLEALKIIAIYRLILPESEIRVCGGRPSTLRDLNSLVFFAGANGLLIGNYLTTQGREPHDDLTMIRDLGLEVST